MAELIHHPPKLKLHCNTEVETAMKIHSVKSSDIDIVCYDEHSHTMRVGFRHDKPAEFCHVPETIFQAFISARSKNRFFKRHILGEFPC